MENKQKEIIEKMKRLIQKAAAINDSGDWGELGDVIADMDDLYEEARYDGTCFPTKY